MVLFFQIDGWDFNTVVTSLFLEVLKEFFSVFECSKEGREGVHCVSLSCCLLGEFQ